MNPKSAFLLSILSITVPACLCTPTIFVPFSTATAVPSTEAITPVKTDEPDSCQDPYCQDECTDLLLDMINASNGTGSPLKTFTGSTDSNGEYHELASYRVVGDDLVGASYLSSPPELERYKQDTSAHHSTWQLFVGIIPQNSRQMVNEYIVFTDGSMELLAAVEQKDIENDTWALEVDIIDARDQLALTATLLHEFAHLLTLNNSQTEINNNACMHDYANPGCGRAGSYIDDFYNQFWGEIYDEWIDINAIPDEDIRYQELDDFYHKYQSQFLTEYSATDAAEDIAEAWMYYILVPKPDGDTPAEEKILFFYDYPELVQLRGEIVERLCGYFSNQTTP